MAEQFLLFPIRLSQTLAAVENARCAFATFAHAATITQIRIRKLFDPGADYQVGIVSNLALVNRAVPMQDDFEHEVRPEAVFARMLERSARCSRVGPLAGPWRRSPN